MIQELKNFTKDISQSASSMNLNLAEGLYLSIDENDDGELYVAEEQLFTKKSEMNDFFEHCLALQTRLKPVSFAKIFNPNKKIFGNSCSGFALYFNKKNLKKNLEKDGKALVQKEIEQYFKGASPFVKEDNHKEWVSKFQNFCIQQLIEVLAACQMYQEAKDDFDVHLFLRMPNLDDYQVVYDAYVAKNVFNKDDYNTTIDDVIYGVADTMSSFSDKKMYWRHKTAPFEYNYRMTGEDAKLLWQFYELKKRVLPNPLPIFIDKEELQDNELTGNKKVIALLKENSKISYSEILKKVFSDIEMPSNYYLLYFLKGEMVDIDFVPAFDYKLEINIEDIFYHNINKKWATIYAENTFEFEWKIANKIFNRQLITNTKAGGLWLKYFGDIEYNPKYITHNTLNQLLSHRKSFYDYIYKAQKGALQTDVFRSITLSSILDDIQHSTMKDTKYLAIREKLNIYFNLKNFNFNTDKKNNSDMASKLNEHLEMMRQLIIEDKIPDNDDDFFAFAAGQVLRYIFTKSKSGDKSYKRLEPFLQKSDYNEFRKALNRFFTTYAHENFALRFNRPFAYVMDYPLKSDLKELVPIMLAGFFSDCQIFTPTEKKEVQEEVIQESTEE